MKTFKKLLIAISISALSITNVNANAADITPNDIKQLAQNTQADSMHKYSADGKIKYEYQIKTGADGKPELVTKKSYLPAVTDGKIIDKTRSYKLALNAKKFAKYLSKGAGYVTFAQMAIDLLGSGVDYVLDPKNNSIQIYKHKYERCYGYGYSADNPLAVAKAQCGNNATYQFVSTQSSNVTRYDTFKASCEPVNTIICSVPISERDKDKKVMTEEEFAKEVLKAAAATQNNDKAKKVVIDYAKQEILDGDYDDTINEIVNDINSDTNTQPNPTDTTPSKDTDNNPANANPQTNPKTDELKPKPKDEGGGFELPPFCSWAGKVCEWIDWTKERPELQDEDVPEKNVKVKLPQEFDKDYVKTNAQCPSDIVREINTGFAVNKLVFEMSPICDFVSTYIKPVIMFIAYLSALLTISNAFKVG